jgi:acyl carrier protein phosphodiesterase
LNFLAHCALARSHPDLMVGGFLGDFIKGRISEELPARIADGVRLHRRLDAYSAEQPEIRRSVLRLPSELRRVAPVFVDLVADHVLARRFAELEGQSLSSFTRYTYEVLDDSRDLYPDPARRFLDAMRTHDLLGAYIEPRVIERAFLRIAKRLGQIDIVAPAMATLDAQYVGFETDFSAYYPDLKCHTADWLAARETRG